MMKRKLICIILSILVCASFSGVNAISQEVSKDLAEMVNAYNWASGKGVTTMKTFKSARMGDGLTRGELAKMMSVYIEKMGGQTNYLNRNVSYKDVNSSLGDLEYYIKKAYQYQIMGIDAYGNPLEYFNPYRKVTRAEFGTVFSRVLYGSIYNKDGSKYYENHLKALKNAGIMNKINDPFQMEIRGYVMIMMMRTDKTFVPKNISDEELIEQINEILKEIEASNNETKQNENDNKKGTITISATAKSERKAIKGAVSDLDTLTFRASDSLSIDKIVLERYGNSSKNDVDEVRLEDQDGNMVSNIAYGLQNDKATLTIKKDYKAIYGTEKWTIVLKLNNNATAGGTIGFRLSDMTSSAKTIDMDYYNANTYDIIGYEGNKINLTSSLSTTHYNYDDNEYYKIASIKIKAGDSAVLVKGFTLTYGGNLTINNSILDDVSFKVNGNNYKGGDYSIKNGKLLVSFDDVEIPAKSNTTFDLYIKLTDLTDFGKYIQLQISQTSDAQIVEKKTGARVNVDMDGISWPKIYFDKKEDTSNDNTSNNNTSNDNTSNNNTSNDNTSNNNTSNNNTSNNNTSNNNTSNAGNDNCIEIEVDNGNSYSFCITKWKDNNSKYSVKVSNAKDLTMCSVGRKGYGSSWDFYNCEGVISNWGTSGIYDLSLTISYNKKQYTKRANYDLASGTFVNENSNNQDDSSSENDSSNSGSSNSSDDSSNDISEQKELKVTGNGRGGDSKVIDLFYGDTINLDYIRFINKHDYNIENVNVKLRVIGTTNLSYINKIGIQQPAAYDDPCTISKMVSLNGEGEIEINVGKINSNSSITCSLAAVLQYNHSNNNPDLDNTELGIEIVDVTADDTDVDVSHNPTLYTINQ